MKLNFIYANIHRDLIFLSNWLFVPSCLPSFFSSHLFQLCLILFLLSGFWFSSAFPYPIPLTAPPGVMITKELPHLLQHCFFPSPHGLCFLFRPVSTTHSSDMQKFVSRSPAFGLSSGPSILNAATNTPMLWTPASAKHHGWKPTGLVKLTVMSSNNNKHENWTSFFLSAKI